MSITPQFTKQYLRLLEILAVAIVYVLTARLGQIFAMEPGNITPVWLPSGIMLSWVILRGHHLLAGVFLGAFAGNSWAYLDFGSFSAVLPGLFAGLMNGLGDMLSVYLSIILLAKHVPDMNFFRGTRPFLAFFLSCVVTGPLVSAVIGVGSLWLSGILENGRLLISLLTWFLGDSDGVLLLAPVLLINHFKPGIQSRSTSLIEPSIFVLLVIILPVITFYDFFHIFSVSEIFIFSIPVFLWAITRLDMRLTFSAATIFTTIVIIMTWAGLGSMRDSSHYETIYEIQIFILIGFSSIFIANAIVFEKELALAELNSRIEHDSLTGLFNRSRLRTEMQKELDRYNRYGTVFSAIMFDIDHFKQVNDNYGHEVGDEVLKNLSRHVSTLIRTTDTLSRWGGEEFVIVLPETGIDRAYLLAERIRSHVQQAQLISQQKITISLGVTMVCKGDDQHELLQRVDSAMYLAKQTGRNRVCQA